MLEVAEINRAIGAKGVLPAECRELVRFWPSCLDSCRQQRCLALFQGSNVCCAALPTCSAVLCSRARLLLQCRWGAWFAGLALQGDMGSSAAADVCTVRRE